MPQIEQRALDTPIAPRRVLCCHTNHELLDLRSDTRSAERSSLRTPVKLPGDQSLVPPEKRLRRHQRRELLETLATERLGERRKTAAFRIGEAEPAAAELGFEDAILCEEVSNHLLLVPLEPPSYHDNQDLGNHQRSFLRGEVNDAIICSIILPS